MDQLGEDNPKVKQKILRSKNNRAISIFTEKLKRESQYESLKIHCIL